MKVTVYTTLTCPFCDQLQNYLNEKGIDHEEKRVDEDAEIRKELEQRSGGFLGVPFTHIKYEDGNEDTVIGFDKNRLNQLLNIE